MQIAMIARFALVALLAGCAVKPPPQIGASSAPTSRTMVVSAHRAATEAGVEMLRRGGTAVDAAIAAQAVLAVVEPQASGLLGSSSLLIWDPTTSAMTSIDGMATAPAAATRAVALASDGTLLDPRDVAFSARAVGIPGTLPALAAAHKQAGKLSWAELFAPAIAAAANGSKLPPQLHALLAEPGALVAMGEVATPYLDENGALLAEGAIFRNPALASVLRRIARLGPDGLWAEGGREALLDALSRGRYPSPMTAQDLVTTRPRIGRPICVPYADTIVCTAPPPAMGALVLLQILGMAGQTDPDSTSSLHRFLEASRLAQADRRRYLADPAFLSVPLRGLLQPSYLAARAATIQPNQTMARPRAGEVDADSTTEDPGAPQAGTSQIVAIDTAGLVVSMTSSVNLHFGARLASEGMVLNNALINFAPPPPTTLPERGDRYANEMLPGKRPVSPVSPVIVLGKDGMPVLAGGGAGGILIPDTSAMILMRVLARQQSLAAALAAGQVSAADPDHIAVEAGTTAATLLPALEALGHRVAAEPISTGLAFIHRTPNGWVGAADPRRDGVALGTP